MAEVPNRGHLYSVLFIPSRPDLLTATFGQVPNSYANYHGMFSIDTDAKVTCDGKPVTIGELFTWLAEPRNVEIVFKPDPMRYGVSMDTEFLTEKL